MRAVHFTVLVLAASTGWNAAGAAESSLAQQGTDQNAAVDQLSQQVFSAADKNHNHVLNKTELQNALSALEETIEQWGRSGLIGHKRPRNKEQGKTWPSDATHSNKLSNNNKVSQAEFTFYVHGRVEEADQQWRQFNAMTEAQRKAYAQRRARPRAALRPPF